MFGIAFLMILALAGVGVLLAGLALVAGLVHVAFRVALFPVVLSLGLIKLLVLPIVALVMLVVLAVVAPVVLAVLAVLVVPVAAIGFVCAMAWGGLRLVAAI